jgi:hypothetical protein
MSVRGLLALVWYFPEGLSVNALGAECALDVVPHPWPVVQLPVPFDALSANTTVGVPMYKFRVSDFAKPSGSEKLTYTWNGIPVEWTPMLIL